MHRLQCHFVECLPTQYKLVVLDIHIKKGSKGMIVGARDQTTCWQNLKGAFDKDVSRKIRAGQMKYLCALQGDGEAKEWYIMLNVGQPQSYMSIRQELLK